MPMKICRIGLETSSSTMPLSRLAIKIAPRTAPGTEPMPPANEVPPMTVAEITYSSCSCPIEFAPEPSRAVVITAAIAETRRS